MVEYTKELAELIVNTSYDDLPPEVVEKAKIVMLDTLGCAVAGYTVAKEECSWAINLAKEMGGPPESTIWVDGSKTSAMAAALADGCMVHTIDFDDTHTDSITHLGSAILGCVLPLGEKLHATGKEVLTAFVLGFEVAARVGNSVNKGTVHYQFKYWHPTATAGTIGAAASCAKLMKFDVEQTRMTIGLGIDQATGFRYSCIQGDFAKTLHAGWGSMRGVMSAQIIGLGATGPRELLGDPLGYCYATCTEPGMEYLNEGLGKGWLIMEDALKMYPSLLGSHAGIEGVINIVSEQDIHPEEIDTITIRLTPLAKGHGLNYEPTTVMAARLSIPYCIALAATLRRAGLTDFNEDRIHDPEFLSFMKKINIVPWPDFVEQYPDSGFSSEAIITTTDGRNFSYLVPYCKGHACRAVDEADIQEKYYMLTTMTWPKDRAKRVYDSFQQIESLADIQELIALMHS